MTSLTPNYNLSLPPIDIENVIVQENDCPVSYENITIERDSNKNNEYKPEYLYEKIKYVFTISVLIIPFSICSLYYAVKNNDSCIHQYTPEVGINLFDYLIGIFCFYTYLWIFDMVTIYFMDFYNNTTVEQKKRMMIVAHVMINIIASVYSMVAYVVYNRVYNDSTYHYETNCSKDTKNYINGLIIMNIILFIYIVVLSILNIS